MKNFIPERVVRATGRMMRMNIDDGDIFIGEFASGAIGSIQTSFVTVGNYPGSRRACTAARGRSSAGSSRRTAICESLKAATADQVEFREIEVPERLLSAGRAASASRGVAVLREPRHSFITRS